MASLSKIGWRVLVGAALLLFNTLSASVRAQVLPLPLRQAAQATELPLGAWGPYSGSHAGPCYLANRFPGQLYAFPIVIGQMRQETVWQTSKSADGKSKLILQEVTLQRRLMGLSPVQGSNDDRVTVAQDWLRDRHARVIEADADGYLWTAESDFAAASVSQSVVAPVDGNGVSSPVAAWGAGHAMVTCFPAFTDAGADGLLIRVTLENRSADLQSWYVDLLGGLDTLTEQFLPQDLTIQLEGDHLTLHHAKGSQTFALAARAPFPVTSYVAQDRYFTSEGAVTANDRAGKTQPLGAAPAGARGNDPAGVGKSVASDTGAGSGGAWGLTRVNDIAIPPGGAVTFWLSVGVGADADSALTSARNLLHVAEDAQEPGKPERVGAYSKALAAHKAAVYDSGDSELNRLLSQSLANVPFSNWRRLGVASRDQTTEPTAGRYRPGIGGMIALGWSLYRPDWAATQLNAWFATRTDPEAPLDRMLSVPPTDIFALWELYQRTGDRAMLETFYPFARRRYRELLASGRIDEHEWLFAWLSPPPGIGRPVVAQNQPASRRITPDYSAEVIRAARILRLMGRELDRKPDQLAEYTGDIEAASRALTARLWSPEKGVFVSAPLGAVMKPVSVEPPKSDALDADSLTTLFPLISGADLLTPEQTASLLKKLKDPAAFWSLYGLRSESKSSVAPASGAAEHSVVRFGVNWMFWKALLDLGEADAAHRLADNLLNGYRAASRAANMRPQWLDAETGLGGGASDYSGDACALLPLYAAYHQSGVVTAGWNLAILDHFYDPKADSLRVTFRSEDKTGQGLLLCVLGKPKGAYKVSGSVTALMQADENGLLTLKAPADSGTQQITIAAIMAADNAK